jgi:hypothetical protein
MASINCPKCGASNDSSSTFCGNCGYSPQASGAGTFYPPQGQQQGANVPPPPPPPFRAGNMPSAPTYSAGNMPAPPTYPMSSTPSSPNYPTGSTPSSPNYPTGTVPSSTYAGGGTNLPPPQPRRGKKGMIAILAVVVVVILIVGFSLAFALFHTSAPTASAGDPITGDWDVTYGAPAVVTISGSGGSYTEVAKTPVRVTGSSCDLPPGTLIASFSGSGNSYSGQHGLWFVNNCAFARWTSLSLTRSGDTLTGILVGSGTVTFTKVSTPVSAKLTKSVMSLRTERSMKMG